jgi:hypothetical protein
MRISCAMTRHDLNLPVVIPHPLDRVVLPARASVA